MLPKYLYWLLTLTSLVGVLLLLQNTANGQYGTAPTYSDYYSNQLGRDLRPGVNVGRYTFDKYFYHSPAVSPYSSLLRYQSAGTLPNYFRYVVPEEQRRRQYMSRLNQPLRSSRRMSSAAGYRSLGSYRNHWYGSRAALGLPD